MRENDKLNVLIVDDEPSVCELLSGLLSTSEREVSTHDNPSDALRFIEEHPVDVAFLDLMLPGMTGFDLAERIKNKHPSSRVVICTGYHADDYMTRAREARVEGVLQKPFKLCDILQIINAQPRS